MFIVFYVYKQSMKPGEKQQTNHLQYFFSLKYTHPQHEPWSGSSACQTILAVGVGVPEMWELSWQEK